MSDDSKPQLSTPKTPTRARSSLFARGVTYGIVIVLGGVAVAFTPPLPDKPPVAAVIAAAPRAPVWLQRHDTLARGETLGALLERVGIRGIHASNILRSAKSLDERRAPAGLALTVRQLETDSLPSELIFKLAIDRILTVRRSDSGWVSTEANLPWKTDTLAVSGKITSTLYDALDAAESPLPSAARAELAWALADIYEYRVDMSRDLQPNDVFRVLVERKQGPDGAVRLGSILASTFSVGGSEIQAIRHHSGESRPGYFDQDGKSMRAAFLRAPLEFRRISSVFGMRKHPILGIWRQHAGTDYVASQGTPVRSVGDGVVTFAGRKGGYGNVLEVRHRNGFVTRYGHLRAFAKTARRGSRVEIGQTIGFVGMTGLATAPHLHFEVLVGGTQKNPRVALAMKGGEPLPASEQSAFARTRGDLIALLARETEPARLAARP
ncbi:MAG TPA: M23 family metallopeptidase [Gemmatimonadaceae bacterium]|nr:M23 family metallopeptidase [Gemmatimonadaceae bacterium]